MNIHLNAPYEIRDGETIRRAFTGPVIKSMDRDTRQIEFVISTATKDRYGDMIKVSGWDLKAYRQNPVVLFGHASSIPPIGKSIKVWKEGDALRSIAQFMTPDLSAFADSVFRMYLEGYLRAVSVGFKPIKYKAILDEEGNPTYAYEFLNQELLEYSSVPIPANPEALVAARQKGIDTLPFKSWAEEMLDNWSVVNRDLDAIYGVSRKDIETIRRRAAGAGASIQVSPDIQDELLRKNLEAIRKSKAEKADAKVFETIDIGGEEHDLPVRQLKEGEVLGTCEFKATEKGTISIVKADDLVMIDPTIYDDVVMSITTAEYDGGSMLLFNLEDEIRLVSYELIGIDTDGRLFASKVKDVVKELATETIDTGGEIEEEIKESSEVVLEADESADETAAVDIEPVLRAEPVMTETVINKEDEDLLDFAGVLGFTEQVLTKFELSLDEFTEVTKHEGRKKYFLASYMRELADRLDGGKPTMENKEVVVKTAKVDKPVSFSTSDEVTAYLKSITSQLEPMLAEIITSKLAKLRGRLD